MKRILVLVIPVILLAVAILGVQAACNNVGSCPAASSIKPGGSCSGDYLECPYTLQTPSFACDGTSIEGGLGTSCICTGGTWACPAAVSCEGGPAEDGGGDATGDGTVSVESGADDASNPSDAMGDVSASGGDSGGDSGGNGGGDSGKDGASDGAADAADAAMMKD